jgi:hypothetical protein
MTNEELIRVLRSINPMKVDDCFLQSHYFVKAADRIEQLIQDCNYWSNDSAVAWDKCEIRKLEVVILEAKLEKAMAALRYVVSVKGLTDPIEHGYDAVKFARAVLAELEKTE